MQILGHNLLHLSNSNCLECIIIYSNRNNIQMISSRIVNANFQQVRANFRQNNATKNQFYLATSINQIMFNQRNSLTNVFYKDHSAFNQDIEYLKRIYHYKDQNTGKLEIFHRIQLFSDFYATKQSIASFYPTMILTKTSPIFMKRFHRVTKTVDPQDTSNMFDSQDAQKNSNSELSRLAKSAIGQKQMTIFLESFNTQDMQLLQYQSEDQLDMILKSSFYSIKPHDIYNQSFQSDFSRNVNKILHGYEQQEQSDFIDLKKTSKQAQSQVSHLICQFDDYDIQQTLVNYNRYCKQASQKQGNFKLNRQNGAVLSKYMKQANSNQRIQIGSLAFSKQEPKKKLNTKISIEPLDYGLRSPSQYSLNKKMQLNKIRKVNQEYQYQDYGQPQDVTSLKFSNQNQVRRNHKMYSNYLRYMRNQVNQAKQFSEEKTNHPSHYNFHNFRNQPIPYSQRRQTQQTLQMQKRQRIREKAAEMISVNFRPKAERKYNPSKQN